MWEWISAEETWIKSERLGYLQSVIAHGKTNNCSAVASSHSCVWVSLFIAVLEWPRGKNRTAGFLFKPTPPLMLTSVTLSLVKKQQCQKSGQCTEHFTPQFISGTEWRPNPRLKHMYTEFWRRFFLEIQTIRLKSLYLMKSLFLKVFWVPNKGFSIDFKICPIKYSLYFIQ